MSDLPHSHTPEADGPEPSYEERVESCPIHRWADIDDYLARAQVPQQVWRTFHELILARGAYPANCTPDQASAFARSATQIMKDSGVDGLTGHSLFWIFGDLTGQWRESVRQQSSRSN